MRTQNLGPGDTAVSDGTRRHDALEKHQPSKTSAKSTQALTSTEWKPWADKICAAWQKCVEDIIATGRLLIEAKKELGYGSWLGMVTQKLPFRVRTAQRLIAIAKNPVIADATHGSLLPPSWRTLYEMTRLPDDVLREKFASGAITPSTERKDIVRMRPRPEIPVAQDISVSESARSEQRQMVDALLRNFKQGLSERLKEMDVDIRRTFLDRLAAIILKLQTSTETENIAVRALPQGGAR
jgi:hypothetical protein